ncbi:MAG: hypothetical protein ACJA2G_001195 [Cognaticolwellia sp.]|jgi:hypothetical protein
MKSFVFRSLPLSADSRILRNANLLDDNEVCLCTWETSSPDSVNKFTFPFGKGGSSYFKVFKYLFFVFWVPYIIFCHARKSDRILFMDLETIFLGYFAARIRGCYCIFDVVDPFSQTKSSLFSFPRIQSIVDKVEFYFATHADLAIFPDESRKDYYKDRQGLVFGSSSLIVENVPDYNDCIIPSSKINDPKKIVIGYFGTLDFRTRGLENLIDLANTYPNRIKLLVAGQGAMSDLFLSLSKINNNIDFFGGFNRLDLAGLYSKVDFTFAYYSPCIELHKYAAPNKYYEHLYFLKPIITHEVIPQSKVINSLSSGVLIDFNKSSYSEVLSYIEKYLSSQSFNLFEVQKYWCENYGDYYSRIVVLFRKRLEGI